MNVSPDLPLTDANLPDVAALPGPDCLTVGALMRHHAAAGGARLAWVDEQDSAVTFETFNRRVNRLNHAALAQGLRAGDRVAVLSRNCRQTIEVLGLGKSGVVTVPLNWRLTSDELLALLQHCRPRLLFVDAEDQGRVDAMRASLPNDLVCVAWERLVPGWLDYETWLEGAADDEPPDVAEPGDPVCLLYTSGTTGVPKAVALSHRFGVGNARQSACHISGLQPADRVLAAMPLFHVGGLFYHTLASFWAGCTTYVMARFEVAPVLAALGRERITHVHLVPTMVAALLDHPDLPATDLSALRVLFYAASPMPVSLLRRAMHHLPGCAFTQGYGSTEAGVVSALGPELHRAAGAGERPARLAACGEVVPEVAVRVLDDAGAPCAPGRIGEIEVRSPYGMLGYWQPADASAAAAVWHDGWLRTGDLGYQDNDALLYLVDRRHDMIVTGGENVYPSEVEACLQGWPEVREACVFGQPHPHWVEQVAVALVCRPGHELSAAEVQRRLRQVLSPYKCPRVVYFLDDLPKNGTGKVARRVLQQQLSASIPLGGELT